MALRTFTRPGVLVTDATTISQPATIEPPFREPVPDKMTPDKHSEPWNAFFTELAKRLSALQSSGVILQTGTSMSDPAGAISVTLPVPYALRTIDFQCDARPTEPLAFFNQGTVQSLPLDVITGELGKDDGTGNIVAVPNAPFTWFATGV